jgi:hypothetical protein
VEGHFRVDDITEWRVLQDGEYCKEGISELRALQGGVLGRVEGIVGWSIL